MRKGPSCAEWTPNTFNIIIWMRLQTPALCIWWLSLSGKDGFHLFLVWVFLLAGFHPPSVLQDTFEICTLLLDPLLYSWQFMALLCSLCLFLSLCLSSYTHTHTLQHELCKRKRNTVPSVPPTNLNHVISVLTYSKIYNIKISYHTYFLLAKWSQCAISSMCWLEKNFQTL